MSFKRLLHTLKTAVFPPKCLSCEDFFHIPFEQTAADPLYCGFEQLMRRFLCEECRTDFSPTTVSYDFNGGIARAVGKYSGALRDTIHAFKYYEKTGLAKPFGVLLFSAFIRYWNPEDIDLILPVPLHINRLRKRGFNQAFLMLKYWKNMAESVNIRPVRVEPEALLRIRDTRPQVGLTREEREENIKDAFRLSNISAVTGKKILLTDDVYTRGATVKECAKELLNAGAVRTDVLTLARA
jgi:ComF family protein